MKVDSHLTSYIIYTYPSPTPHGGNLASFPGPHHFSSTAFPYCKLGRGLGTRLLVIYSNLYLKGTRVQLSDGLEVQDHQQYQYRMMAAAACHHPVQSPSHSQLLQQLWPRPASWIPEGETRTSYPLPSHWRCSQQSPLETRMSRREEGCASSDSRGLASACSLRAGESCWLAVVFLLCSVLARLEM